MFRFLLEEDAEGISEEALLRRKANLATWINLPSDNMDGLGVMHFASYNGNLRMIRLLIQQLLIFCWFVDSLAVDLVWLSILSVETLGCWLEICLE